MKDHQEDEYHQKIDIFTEGLADIMCDQKGHRHQDKNCIQAPDGLGDIIIIEQRNGEGDHEGSGHGFRHQYPGTCDIFFILLGNVFLQPAEQADQDN